MSVEIRLEERFSELNSGYKNKVPTKSEDNYFLALSAQIPKSDTRWYLIAAFSLCLTFRLSSFWDFFEVVS